MANYYTDRANAFIDNAENVYDYISGNYMKQYVGRELVCRDQFNDFGPLHFLEIGGYRKSSSNAKTRNDLKESIFTVLEACFKSGLCIGFFIVNDNGKIRVFYGTQPGNVDIRNNYMRNIPELETENIFVKPNSITEHMKYSGIVTGVPGLKCSVVDDLVTVAERHNAMIAILAKPLTHDEITEYTEGLLSLHSSCSAYGEIERRIGGKNGSGIKEKPPGVSKLTGYVEKQIERISVGKSGLWQYGVWFGSDDEENAKKAGNHISGIMNSSDDTIEESNWFFVSDNPLKKVIYALPTSRYASIPVYNDKLLQKGSLISYITTEELTNLMHLPVDEHRGFSPVNIRKQDNSPYMFSINPPEYSGDVINIGKIADSDIPYGLPINRLSEHMLVAGATGGGKTTTIKTILRELHRKNIPFCVLEPEKKHYWELISGIPNLRVLTSSDDGEGIHINILEPEEGVQIGNHMLDLFEIFSGSFDMEEPTRAGFLGLLKYTYNHFGWNETDVFYYGTHRKIPTIEDLRSFLSDYCQSELAYSNEVLANIHGSLKLRIDQWCTGDTKSVLTGGTTVSGKELCSYPTVVELDSLGQKSKAFITGIILSKMYRYLKGRPFQDNIRNVVVVEEAHNVFRKRNETISGTSISSNYFCRLLSDIRAYGTGIIIADQRPFNIDSDAIANTAVKVIHTLNSGEDINEISIAISLSDARTPFIRSLKTGEAIIAISGEDNICHVKIGNRDSKAIKNCACIMCKYRNGATCVYNDMANRIETAGYDGAIIAKSIFGNHNNQQKICELASSLFDRLNIDEKYRICAMGCLLNRYVPAGREIMLRRIIFSYAREITNE